MSVLKRGSVRYFSDGVDISNTVTPHGEFRPAQEASAQTEQPPEERAVSIAEQFEIREQQLIEREAAAAERERELARLKEEYIEKGKAVILDAKSRAESISAAAEENARAIVAEAEQQRDDVYIKARAEGFEQGRKEGVAACRKEGESVLEEARAFAESINAQKEELFEQYEKEIFDTVMAIAAKVTLDSMAVKDGTAAKKLIKKAAKEFRNSQTVRITLDKNGATETLAADYEYLKELCGGTAHVEVELLPDAEAGTVIVDNGSEITDAGVQTQLRMIKELGTGRYRGRKKAKPDPEKEE